MPDPTVVVVGMDRVVAEEVLPPECTWADGGSSQSRCMKEFEDQSGCSLVDRRSYRSDRAGHRNSSPSWIHTRAEEGPSSQAEESDMPHRLAVCLTIRSECI